MLSLFLHVDKRDQCRAFNGIKYDGKRRTWEPMEDAVISLFYSISWADLPDLRIHKPAFD